LAIDLLIRTINFIANLFILLVIVNSFLSYFMDHYHPVRQAIERIVAPLLNPIRRVVPLAGMFDFSPMILIFLIWILQTAVINVLSTLR
jgi:YggT family protein